MSSTPFRSRATLALAVALTGCSTDEGPVIRQGDAASSGGTTSSSGGSVNSSDSGGSGGSVNSGGSVKTKDSGADFILDGARANGGNGPARIDSGARDTSRDARSSDARVPPNAGGREAGRIEPITDAADATADAPSEAASHGTSTGGSGTFTPCTSNGLHISYSPMYSAYIDDPSITFRIPAMVDAAKGAPVMWAASDPSMVRFEVTGPGAVIITTAKAGTVTIFAQWNGACGTAVLIITEATKAEWLAGKQRYDNGNPLPDLPTDPKTGIPAPPFSQTVIDPPERPPACTSCHGDKPTSSYFRAPSPDPRRTAGFSDIDVQGIVTQGQVPAMAYYDESLMPHQYFPFFHRWQDIYSSDDLIGIVVYLRSLPPSTQ